MSLSSTAEEKWSDLAASPIKAVEGDHPRPYDEVPRSKRTARLVILAIGILLDVALLVAAFLAVSVLRHGMTIQAQTLNMLMVLIPVYLGIAHNSNAYALPALTHGRIGAYRAASSFFFAVAAVALIVFFLKVSSDFSRLVFGLASLASFIVLPIMRFSLAGVARRLLGDSLTTDILICDGVETTVPKGFYFADTGVHRLSPAIDDPLMMDRLGRFVKNADRVVVACKPENRHAWAIALKGADVNAQVLAPELDILGPLELGRFEGQTTLQIALGPLRLSDRALKRGLDLLVAGLALIALAPVLTLVALAIKIDSPGPILFVQRRIGQGNRQFQMFKFRSMRMDTSDGIGVRSTERADERITRVGAWIRKTSIDELPQIANVLLGTMSIVGPRPHAVGSMAEDRLFWDIDTRYWHRHAMKPGLTGLAQIRGFRGATSREADLTDRLQADLEYMSGWSVWRDIGIILSTFRVIVHKNAF